MICTWGGLGYQVTQGSQSCSWRCFRSDNTIKCAHGVGSLGPGLGKACGFCRGAESWGRRRLWGPQCLHHHHHLPPPSQTGTTYTPPPVRLPMMPWGYTHTHIHTQQCFCSSSTHSLAVRTRCSLMHSTHCYKILTHTSHMKNMPRGIWACDALLHMWNHVSNKWIIKHVGQKLHVLLKMNARK